MSEYLEQDFIESETRELHLRDYLRVLNKRKGIILSVSILVFLAAVIFTYTAETYYTASSRVLIEKNQDLRGIDIGLFYSYDPDFHNTQAELIKSLNVAQRVVESLNLASEYKDYFFPPQKKNHSPFNKIIDPIRSKIASLFSSDSSEENPPETEKPIPVQEDITSVQKNEEIENSIAARISSGLSVTPVEETKIVMISYSGRDPEITALITNAVVEAYMQEMLEIRMASTSQTIRWMTQKADEERKKLERSEEVLQQYKRENDLVTIEDRMTIYPEKLRELTTDLRKAETERREMMALVSQIEKADGNFVELENIPVFADNQVLKEARYNISEAKQKIKELSKKYGPKHPVMVSAIGELEGLQSESRREINRINAATRNAAELAELKERDIRILIEETKTEILDLNEKFIEYTTLAREVESNRSVYEALGTGLKQQNVTEQAQSVNIWVMEKAEPPGGPSKPNKRRNLLLGIVLGLFGGIGLAYLIEYIDNTAKSDVELEHRYGLTVLGTVENLSKSGETIESHILEQPLSPLAESYRLIRSGLLLSSAEKPPGTILITSMGAKEGKTSTTLNLARILAQGGKKVLIIDCDLRRPRMHNLTNIANEIGLSSYLSGLTDEDVVVSIAEGTLSLIPSGPIPPNPAELLGSRRMEELLERMRQQFDFVLLDSSPVQSVTDSLALGRIVDGTIIVVRFGKTTYDTLTSGLKKLHDVNVNLLGFVLNGLRKGDAKGYYYGYYSYYSKDEYHK